jgi:insertion element IS1 protein InsB
MQDAPTPNPLCPACAATYVVRNGHNRSGTPTFLCRACGRRFVAQPQAGPVPEAKRELVLRLLGERMSLRAIARVAEVSRSWLQRFVNARYRDDARWPVEPAPEPPPKKNATS